MLDAFAQRERFFEKQFALNEDAKFRAHVRRARMVGAWAAARVGWVGDASHRFVQDAVAFEVHADRDERLFRHVRAVFDRTGVAQSDHQIRARMAALLDEARRRG